MPAPQSGPAATEADKLMEGTVKPALQPQQRVLSPPSELCLCFIPEMFGLLSRKGKRRESGESSLVLSPPSSGMEGREDAVQRKL